MIRLLQCSRDAAKRPQPRLAVGSDHPWRTPGLDQGGLGVRQQGAPAQSNGVLIPAHAAAFPAGKDHCIAAARSGNRIHLDLHPQPRINQPRNFDHRRCGPNLTEDLAVDFPNCISV